MKEDSIQREVRRKVKEYWYNNPHMRTFKMEDMEGNQIKCKDCDAVNFKLSVKMGGFEIKKSPRSKKVIDYIPLKFNYACKCGTVLVLNEGEFKHSKLKYACGAGSCPFGKTKMDKDCLSCKYIVEK